MKEKNKLKKIIKAMLGLLSQDN